MIKVFLRGLGIKKKEIDYLYDNKEEIIINKDVFLVDKNLVKVYKKIYSVTKTNARHIGIFIERQEKRDEIETGILDLIEKLSREKGVAVFNYVIVNKSAEWFFLCGKDVFKENIISMHKQNMSTKVVVLNQKKQVLGIGIITEDKDKTIIQNILDRGVILRKDLKQLKKKKRRS